MYPIDFQSGRKDTFILQLFAAMHKNQWGG
jgi:hypothetical protein